MTILENSCPILSNRFHPTKQHSLCCRSGNCISLARSGQSAVDPIDSFDLSNGKVYYRFDKCGRRSDNRELNVPVKSKLQHPPRAFEFLEHFCSNSPSRGRKAVEMPHHRSIPGDQMPPPPGNFSVAFIMLRKLCM